LVIAALVEEAEAELSPLVPQVGRARSMIRIRIGIVHRLPWKRLRDTIAELLSYQKEHANPASVIANLLSTNGQDTFSRPPPMPGYYTTTAL
jgi:hypothetical protein